MNKTVAVASYIGKGKLFNSLVRNWDNTDISHTELVLNVHDNDILQSWSSSFMDGGVRGKSIKLNPENWLIVEIPITNDEYKFIIDHIDKTRGLKYDVLGVFTNSIGAVSNNKQKWFCNEWVGAALQIMEPHRYRPASFHNIAQRLSYERRNWEHERMGILL